MLRAQADLSKPIIWGAQCKVSDDLGLAFGGCEQAAAAAHTRVLMAGKWLEVHDDLRKANPLQPLYDPVWSIRDQVKDASATARSIYFGGAPPVEQDKAAAADLAPALDEGGQGHQRRDSGAQGHAGLRPRAFGCRRAGKP